MKSTIDWMIHAAKYPVSLTLEKIPLAQKCQKNRPAVHNPLVIWGPYNDPKLYPIWHLANLHVNDDLAMESTVKSSVTTSVVKVEPPKIETAAFFGQCVFVISGQ